MKTIRNIIILSIKVIIWPRKKSAQVWQKWSSRPCYPRRYHARRPFPNARTSEIKYLVDCWLYNYYKATCPCALWSSRTKFIVNIHSVKNWKKKIGRQKTRWNIKHLQNKKNQYFQDVSKKDFPCGDLKEEKGIQVQLVAPRLRFLLPHSLQEWFSF